ncbi:NUDIX hydrolase [Magnetospira sp. QH-2]|uniref:NUDIX hydrolase n=1 Tax=Magnetospira sp. (strain QH-2) TaxID=1288970 RepID=UPI0003E80C24|nr:NUDIX hydrolase [Magnetospira sp. QH-2]CCQ75038.1 putative hydrolase, NUDIX family [Magnetospira sp. QH-2]
MTWSSIPYGRRGAPFVTAIPEGDDRERLICPDCGFIQYQNPKIIVGAVCTWEDKLLLCRRAIEPRKGFWTMPAGFMEMNETIAEGAAREVWEEALAKIHIEGLLGIYEIPRIGQTYMIYRARMVSADCGPGPESAEVALVQWEDVPWDDLAFPSVKWALELHRQPPGPPAFTVAT